MFKAPKRITYFVTDLEKAKQWYRNILEMQPVFDSPFAVSFKIGSCLLTLAKSKTSPTGTSDRMEIYWETDDIEAAYQKLMESGAQSHTPVTRAANFRIARVIDPFGITIGLTGDLLSEEEGTVDKQPSDTAMSAAFCRALAAHESRDEIKGPDDLAEIFITNEAKKILQDEKSIKWAIGNLVTSPLYGYFIARTAFIDAIFLNACKEKIPQIVFLGAGYDTRSYRFIDQLGSTKIFELDIHTTQQRKIELLDKNNINIPNSLFFLSIDFKSESIGDVLTRAGFDPEKKTLFIWEGVTYYLSRENVEKTLDFLSRYGADGSILCFDYMTEERQSIRASEPFLFWITPNELAEMLAQYGMSILDHVVSDEMQQRYLTLDDGSPAEEVLSFIYLVNATINK